MIIDGHSHLGLDYHHGLSDMKKYLEYINNLKIDCGIVMPQVNPMYLKNGMYVRPNLKDDNPYSDINNLLYDSVSSQKKLLYVPYLHIAQDKIKYLEELYERMHPVAFKVHGIGSRTIINDFNTEIVNFLKLNNIPLIIHTDFVIKEKNERLKNLRVGNMAYDWGKFLIKNGIRGVLNHGCSYDRRAFELVNSSDLLMVGLGPDNMVKENDNRLVEKISGKYLKDIQKYLDVEKMIFDIDYNWNTSDLSNDYEVINRYKDSFDEEDLKKVLGINAKKFYQI